MSINFIDLFSGIGGFRLGLERTGKYKHVWSNDINKYANQIYIKNFGEENHYSGDIRQVEPTDIPDFDLLCAGFPCQAFSLAGQRKGFEDTRGTLFFEIARIIEAKKPRLLLLENVAGLLSHDKGLTFQIILESLDELGYDVEWQVFNSKHYGVPQHRARVFIIGHLGGGSRREVFPIRRTERVPIEQNKTKEKIKVYDMKQIYREGPPREYNGISPTISTPSGGQRIPLVVADRSRAYRGEERALESPKSYANTLTSVEKDNYLLIPKREVEGVMIGNKSRYTGKYDGSIRSPFQKDGLSWALTGTPTSGVYNDYRIRKFTPRECERLQGFPDDWTEGLSNTQRYKCLGNAVTVNVIEFLGRRIYDSSI